MPYSPARAWHIASTSIRWSVRQLFKAYTTKFETNNPKLNVTWSTDAIRIAESGNLAIQTGEYHLTGLGPKGDGEDKGRFVTVWTKVNGEWKVAHDIGSTTMPEVAAEKKQ